MWEAVGDALGDAAAQIHGERRESYREFEHRAARLASALQAEGIRPGAKVAMYVYNAPEYLETCFAAFKLGAVPVNVNYRYLADELHYLLDNADAEALIYHGALSERVQTVRERLPKLRTLIQVKTTEADEMALLAGAHPYEDLLAAHAASAARPRSAHALAERSPRSADELVFLYTGGTTGLPKGVMWRHGDLFTVFSQGYQALGEVPSTVGGGAAPAK